MATYRVLQSAQSAVEEALAQLRIFPASEPFLGVAGMFPIDLLGVHGTVSNAAAIKPISGSVAQLHSIASQFQTASTQASDAAGQVMTASTDKLPVAWTGPAWQKASVVFASVQAELENTAINLATVSSALTTYADALAPAMSKDATGHAELQPAPAAILAVQQKIQTSTVGQLDAALNQAANALKDRVSAWQGLTAAATTFIETIDQLAGQARAGLMQAAGLDPLTELVIATSQDPDEADLGGGIDDPDALALGSKRLDAMSQADQAKFQALLTASGSPQEAAYLWKAMSAGYPMSTISAFDKAIGANGANPAWLEQHLNIALSSPVGDTQDATYDGAPPGVAVFDQGSHNDCVAASTVMAAAENDPVLTLFLTTGFSGYPLSKIVGGNVTYKPGDDSWQATAARLQALNQYEWHLGQEHDGPDSIAGAFDGTMGVGEWGQNYLANSLLGATNGSHYQFVKMNDAADRADALSRIDTSVDSGIPVTFTIRAEGVTNTFERHQLVIIGRDVGTNMLEIYNPWGYTEWISAQDFVNGDVSSLTGTNMKLPYNIEIPTPAS